MSEGNPPAKFSRSFYNLLLNTVIAAITNMTVWFGVIFFAYLQTESVFVTAIISGLYLVTTAVTGFWFGSLVDNHKKKNLMLISSAVSLVLYGICLTIYLTAGLDAFKTISSPILWIFIVLSLFGVIAGNIRNIALPTLVTVLVPEESRDKANGLVGTATGVAFLVVSVISGLLVGHSGMYLLLILAIIFTIVAFIQLWLVNVPENKIEPTNQSFLSKIDIKGTIRVIKSVPGLFTLILFTTFNNFLGGVFMSLMDAYGLSLVSVEVWGLLWGFLSTAFIFGGIFIAKKGLGKNPLKSLFAANITIWAISSIFTIYPSIVPLIIGMFIYLCVVPFIEASEHTIIQKVVSPERQGRVFGFAQSVEQAASPLTAFLIGPITEFIFIPFMTTGTGASLIGSWFGTGSSRGIALVFTLTGLIGLTVTLIARRTRFYKELSNQYTN